MTETYPFRKYPLSLLEYERAVRWLVKSSEIASYIIWDDMGSRDMLNALIGDDNHVTQRVYFTGSSQFTAFEHTPQMLMMVPVKYGLLRKKFDQVLIVDPGAMSCEV